MIFINHNVASSKNGRQWTGTRSVASKSCQKYYKLSKSEWESPGNKERFLKMLEGKSKPYRVEFTFVRSSRRRFDYINPAQTCQDLMVKHGWLEDDNADILIPVFAPYSYNKDKPGVWIRVI